MGLCTELRQFFADENLFFFDIMAPAITDSTNQKEFPMPTAESDLPKHSSINGISMNGQLIILNGKALQTPETPPIDEPVPDMQELVIKMPPTSSNNSTPVVRNGYKCGLNGSANVHMADRLEVITKIDHISNASDIKDSDLIAKSQKDEVDQFFNAVFANETMSNTKVSRDDLEPANVEDVLQVLESMESPASDCKLEVPVGEFLLPNDEMSDILLKLNHEDDDLIEESISKSLSLFEVEQTSHETRTNQLLMKLRLIQTRLIGYRGCKEIEFFLHFMHDKTKFESRSSNVSNSGPNYYKSTNNNASQREVADNIPKFDMKEFIKRLDIPSMMKSSNQTGPFSNSTTAATLSATNIHESSGSAKYLAPNSNWRPNNYFHVTVNQLKCENRHSYLNQSKSLNCSQNQIKLPKLNDDQVGDLKQTVSMFRSHLNWLQSDVDSDKTDSSSEAESCDEMHSFHNPHQHYLSLSDRSAWHYARDRSRIGSRWSWTESQLADVSNRIRQINEHIHHIRDAYGAVQFEDDPVLSPSTSQAATKSDPLQPQSQPQPQSHSQNCTNFPTDTGTASSNNHSLESNLNTFEVSIDDSVNQTSRTRPLCVKSFKKRKLIHINGLHFQSKKVNKPATVRCFCQPPYSVCVLCTGRVDPKLSKDDCRSSIFPDDNIELLDPHYHKNLSTSHDISKSIHLESISKFSEWQQRILKGGIKLTKSIKKEATNATDNSAKLVIPSNLKVKKTDHIQPKRKYTRHGRYSKLELGKKGKSKNKRLKFGQYISSFHADRHYGDDVEADFVEYGSTGLNGHSSAYHRRTRVDSYDIDNIVIPYSVASATRLEKLQYKEILIPKWRVVDENFSIQMNSSPSKKSSESKDENKNELEEQLSDEAFLLRHEGCEKAEHKKFSNYLKFPMPIRPRATNRRNDSGTVTPDDRLSPHPNSNDSLFLRPQSPPTQLAQTCTTPTPNSSSSINQIFEDVPSSICSSTQFNHPYSQQPQHAYTHSQPQNLSTSGKKRSTNPQSSSTMCYNSGAEYTLPDVPPFDNRTFPLSENEWDQMLAEVVQDDSSLDEFKQNKSMTFVDGGCSSSSNLNGGSSIISTDTSFFNATVPSDISTSSIAGDDTVAGSSNLAEISDLSSSTGSPAGNSHFISPVFYDDDDDDDIDDPEWTVPPGEKT